MIKVELVLRKNLSAILTGVFIAKKNVLPGKFHLFAGNAVVNRQNDDFRHPKGYFDRMNQVGSGRRPFFPGILNPGTNIVGLVTSLPFGLNHLGVTETEKFEGAFDRTGMNRLPQPVENKDRALK